MAEIHVVAGALRDGQGRVLIAQRPRGRFMAGRWEFPGGKLEAGEEALAGLRRELREELGVEVRAARPLIRLRHRYPDRRVLLDVWQVTHYEGEPRSLDAQALALVRPDELPAQDLLEADRTIVAALRLPRRARLVSGPADCGPGDPVALLWPLDRDEVGVPDSAAVRAAREHGHRVFVLGQGSGAIHQAAIAGADGVLLQWQGETLDADAAGRFLIGACCPDVPAAVAAASAGVQFLVVAPPGAPLPEADIFRLCEAVAVPVYAGWYADAANEARLQAGGAHGCAVGSVTG